MIISDSSVCPSLSLYLTLASDVAEHPDHISPSNTIPISLNPRSDAVLGTAVLEVKDIPPGATEGSLMDLQLTLYTGEERTQVGKIKLQVNLSSKGQSVFAIIY